MHSDNLYTRFRHIAGARRASLTVKSVPIADDDDLEDLTLVATNWKANAAIQIAGPISLNWRTPVQRYLTWPGRSLSALFNADC